MRDSPVITAQRLLTSGKRTDAVRVVQSAAAQGDGESLYCKAMWLLAGDILPRDVAAALRSLDLAMTAGHMPSAMLAATLIANGSGTPADWPRANQILRHTRHPVATAQVAMLNRMGLTADGDPAAVPASKPISDLSRLRLAEGFLTPDECQHIVAAAADLLQPATVTDPVSGQNVPHPVRTSDAAVIGPTRETLVIRAINRRIAALTNTHVAQGEALAVLRYGVGQQFKPHLDAFEHTRNQRITTVLMYLNDGFVGGETSFVTHGLKVKPRQGDAIVFDNVRADGRIDATARHAGEPVRSGVKWLATRWIRARPFDVWTGPEAA